MPDWRQQTSRQSTIVENNASSKNEAIMGAAQQEQRNQFYASNDQISMALSSYSSSSNTTTFWNSPKLLDNSHFFIGENPHWDELKSVVDLATDPQSFCYSHTQELREGRLIECFEWDYYLVDESSFILTILNQFSLPSLLKWFFFFF